MHRARDIEYICLKVVEIGMNLLILGNHIVKCYYFSNSSLNKTDYIDHEKCVYKNSSKIATYLPLFVIRVSVSLAFSL